MSVLSNQGDPLMPANLVNAEIPAGVAGVLQKALDLNANQRPSSAAEMKEMLGRSEDFASLAEAAAARPSGNDPRVFSAPTRLMPEHTRADGVIPTDIKTEVMPEYSSDETVVKGKKGDLKATFAMDGSTRAGGRPRRGVSMAAGALLMLLFGGAIAGSLYYLKPSAFGMQVDAGEKEAVTPPSDTTQMEPANVANVQAEAPGPAADPETVSTESSRQTASTGKTAETTRDNKPAAPDKPKVQAGDNNIVDYTVDDPDIPPGGVVITQRDENGKITTMRVNRGGRQPNVPPIPLDELEKFAPGFDPAKMTPAEREKLRKAIKKARTMTPAPPPDQP